MKKTVCMLLVLLAILQASPQALAFTDQKEQPCALSVFLYDAVPSEIDGINYVTPKSDRVYRRNEIICAIVDMTIPAAGSPLQDGYTRLVFSAKNAAVHVAENLGANGSPYLQASANVPAGAVYTTYTQYNSIALLLDKERLADGSVKENADLFATEENERRYRFAVYAKVTAADAFLEATLTGDGFLMDTETGTSSLMVQGGHVVTRFQEQLRMQDVLYVNKTIYLLEDMDISANRAYVIADAAGKVENIVVCYQYRDGQYAEYRMANVNNVIYFFAQNPGRHGVPAIAWQNGDDTQKKAYAQLLRIYMELVKGVFQLDWEDSAHTLGLYFEDVAVRLNDISTRAQISPYAG